MSNVLLAEDNRLNQLVAVGALNRLGCAVEVVSDGAKAVDAWRAGHFDVVLLDVMMPDVDGYEAATRIRAAESDSGATRTPIIGLSARALDADRLAAVRSGMDDYLVKPLRRPDLEAALGRWTIPAAGAVTVPHPQGVAPTSSVDVDRHQHRITVRGRFDGLAIGDAKAHVHRHVLAGHDAVWTVDCTDSPDPDACIQILRSVRGALGPAGTMRIEGATPALSTLVATRLT